MSYALPSLESDEPYVAYSYAYPHKTAYRRLAPPVELAQAWRSQPQETLFAYVHIPFCEMRCAFCNLFTAARPAEELVNRYLAAVERQARVTREILPRATFARFAIGGGTPTYLTVGQLERMFRILHMLSIDPGRVPGSIETSPATATPDRLTLLRGVGIRRISVGVQTLVEAESKRLGRPQADHRLRATLDALAAAGFPCLNFDLIYGIPDQTIESWMLTVRGALEYRPQELYLYPLYVRPFTGLARTDQGQTDLRTAAYREARSLLLASGYRQISMRMFRATTCPDVDEPAYCCQRDGMVGLGSGARSYTKALHYSTEYAVSREAIRELIERYSQTPDAEFAVASHGIHLTAEEQRRRFVIKSLLHVAGISSPGYAETFGTELFDDFPLLQELTGRGLARRDGRRLHLTPAGLEQSDAIGPWLYSSQVTKLSEAYQWR